MPTSTDNRMWLQFLRFLGFSAKLTTLFRIKAGVYGAATGVRKHASQPERDTIQFRDCIVIRKATCFDDVLLDFEY